MNKIYVVYAQDYEEVYVYGIFSSEKLLNDALDILSQDKQHLKWAKQMRQGLQNWYDKTHIPWAKDCNIEPTKPAKLALTLSEYSKTLLTIHEMEIDEVIIDPSPLG